MTTIEDIKADFELLDEWEDRYRYVIELGRKLPPMPDTEHSDTNKVRGCASQVWLSIKPLTDPAPGEAGPRLHISGDSDAHIVKGLVAILLAIYSGKPASEIANLDARPVLAELGLGEHLTPQRSNGVAAMVERIRSDARSLAAGA